MILYVYIVYLHRVIMLKYTKRQINTLHILHECCTFAYLNVRVLARKPGLTGFDSG